ncbi:MAG TPA: hypothetical protein VGR41_06580 [Actinomycetota bacterium]|nr:hypothetical protein [Actinomycetota bacterium]
MEARPTEQELREAFARIEVAVEGGDRDLSGLGFWRWVARVKPDPELSDRWAEQVGRIDRAAFRAGMRLRVPVWAGNALLLAGVAAGAVAVVVARSTDAETLAGLALIAAGVLWSVSTHCLAHWVVGRAVGIRFTDYFLGGPFPPRPGLKTDYATYLRTPPASRAAMHAAGAIATKLSPFVALAFWPASAAPWWAGGALLGLGVLQITTDILFSVKSSDWKKVKRERAVARARAASAGRSAAPSA